MFALVEARRIFIWIILLSSKRYALFYLTSKRCLLKMSIWCRRERYFPKKLASRLDESEIEKTKHCKYNGFRTPIVLTLDRYALFVVFYNDVLGIIIKIPVRFRLDKSKITRSSTGYAKPILLRVVTSLGSVANRGSFNHAGGETPRIVTLRVAARGLFFFMEIL